MFTIKHIPSCPRSHFLKWQMAAWSVAIKPVECTALLTPLLSGLNVQGRSVVSLMLHFRVTSNWYDSYAGLVRDLRCQCYIMWWLERLVTKGWNLGLLGESPVSDFLEQPVTSQLTLLSLSILYWKELTTAPYSSVLGLWPKWSEWRGWGIKFSQLNFLNCKFVWSKAAACR